MQPQIYIATVLLERNRWKPVKEPTFRVSEWVDRFVDAGFDGIELWENHALLAPQEEVQALKQSPLPIRIFNSYATFGPEPDERRDQAAELSKELGANYIKFNVGGDPNLFDTYVRNVLEWRQQLPSHIKPWCECHPGTVLEEPEPAARAFEVWADAGIEAIIHPFNLTPEELGTWFEHLGGLITHMHVQLNRDRRMQSLIPHKPYVKETLQALSENRFTGSFTIEFTEGVASADEDMDRLFASACADMELLRELM